MAATSQMLYRYSAPSRVTADRVDLSTWTPALDAPATNPHFFSGAMLQPDIVARAILAVASVSATRYYVPPATILRAVLASDPVVTCDGERLRFESFSLCCGVHARLDVEPSGLDPALVAAGTTNVDVNPPLREALTRVSGGQPLHLRVGPDEVVADTLAGSVVEKRVPLSARWIKGFGETQVAESRMSERVRMSGIEARRLLQAIPRASSRGVMWFVAAGTSARFVSAPQPGAVCLAGADRLASLHPLLRSASTVTVYGPDVAESDRAAPSAWCAELPHARYTVVLSPEPARGFSGEGGVIASMESERSWSDAAAIGPVIAGRSLADADEIGRTLAISTAAARRGLDVLAASGRVGFDLAHSAYFHRQLPFDPVLLAELQPRRAAAAVLVDQDAVVFDDDGLRAHVTSGDHRYLVVFGGGDVRAATCTCPWYGKHRGDRGPCKHVVAAARVRPAAQA